MTCTAEAIATGPFHGFFHEGATLYRLDPPVIAGGPTKRGIQQQDVSHIIISALDADEMDEIPETVVYAADKDGAVDSGFYLVHGAVLEMYGVNDPAAALTRLGYTL